MARTVGACRIRAGDDDHNGQRATGIRHVEQHRDTARPEVCDRDDGGRDSPEQQRHDRDGAEQGCGTADPWRLPESEQMEDEEQRHQGDVELVPADQSPHAV
jgi:hypothetical protein